MVKSMTGFGKGEATLQNKKITVEIRSLNSKQLDLGLRLPAVYRQSEYEIRNIITRTVLRGKVDVFVTVESQTVETPARINKEVFAAYAGQLRDAARNAQLNYAGIGWDSAALQAIMRLPEVVSTEAESISDEEHAALVAATEAAVAQLDAFRLQEGAILIADLLGRVDKIEGYKQEVVPFEKARTETVRARLLENLEKLQIDVDRNRLEQEMIFYLENSISPKRRYAWPTTAGISARWPPKRRAQGANWASSHRRWAAKSTRWARRPTNRTSRYS